MVRKIIIYSVVLLCLLSTDSFSQSLTDSLVVYYTFDGHSNDLSGNALHANVIGATLVTGHNGAADSAYFFDGLDDYILMPINSKLRPQLPITISFWVKMESLDVEDNKWVSTENVYNNYTGINVAMSASGAWHVTIGAGTGAGPSHRRTKTSASALSSIGTWHHIAAVMRSGTDVDLYVDCVNVGGSYSGSGGPLAYVDSAGNIGRIHGLTATPWTRYFWGALDEYAMWNRALSPAEISQLCTNGIQIEPECVLGVSYSKRNVSCNNFPNGKITVFVNGDNPPFNYSWGNGSTASVIDSLYGGTYQCVVTDSLSCEQTINVDIFEPMSLSPFTIINSPNPGDINLLVTGGVAPYTYNWSTGATSEDVFGLAPGLYFVQVTDFNGCSRIATVWLP